MSESRQLGNYTKKKNKNGRLYRIIYFVIDSEKSTYMADYADPANWVTEEPSYVYYCDDQSVGDHWVITIDACNNGYNWGTGSEKQFTIGGGTTFVKRSVELGEVVFRPEWWNVREATLDDIYEYDGGSREATGILNISSATATPGDYLYSNATDTDDGDPDYTKCPFSNADASKMPVDLINRTVQVPLWVCRIYTRHRIHRYLDWIGVNPGGAGQFSPPSGCSPIGQTAAGKWRAVYQTIEEEAWEDPDTGKQYNLVTRKMLKAPGDLLWNSDAFGGTWKW